VASCAAAVAGCATAAAGSAAGVAGSAAGVASAFCTGAENPVKAAGATGGGAAPKLKIPGGGAGVGATGVADLGEAAEKIAPPPPMPGVKLAGKLVVPLVN
jgi:hypothetical protein